MAAHVIKVPDLGEGIAEVELVAWHVKPGDSVVEDQSLADVMTDKATVEVPSPLAGRVLALGGEVGQTLAVGAELLRIEPVGDGHAPAAPQQGSAASRTDAALTARAASVAAPVGAAVAHAAPAPRIAAPAADETAASGRSAAPVRAASAGKLIASPAVRARAWELGIHLNDVRASGTAGRIMHADLDAHVAGGAPHRTATASRERAAAPPEATREVKIVGLRRKIAQKMQESKRRIPHYTYVEEVDVSELEALRAQLNAKWSEQRARLTLLPFLVRAIVLAVREFPQVNSRFDDEAGVLTQYSAVHMGVATQTDAGLMVPVIRDAQQLDLWACAAQIARLAGAARDGKAVRNELSGSTITITSLGRLGGIMSTPVINHPEVAIVGVNAIVERPVFRGAAVVARQMMNLSSSFDHRVVDGAVGAAFVQSLRELLEHPATLFVEPG